jgi:hypothetical protein
MIFGNFIVGFGTPDVIQRPGENRLLGLVWNAPDSAVSPPFSTGFNRNGPDLIPMALNDKWIVGGTSNDFLDGSIPLLWDVTSPFESIELPTLTGVSYTSATTVDGDLIFGISETATTTDIVYWDASDPTTGPNVFPTPGYNNLSPIILNNSRLITTGPRGYLLWSLATPVALVPSMDSLQSAYSAGAPIVATWANLIGEEHEWVGIAPECSPLDTVSTWVYTGGVQSGSAAFDSHGLRPGRYVARAFAGDSYQLLAESEPFTFSAYPTASIATNSSQYALIDSITLNWSGLTASANSWVGYAPVGSSPTAVIRSTYTGSAATGSATLEGPGTAGTFVARAFADDSTLVGESAPFTVEAYPASTVSTDSARYSLRDPITITWTGLPDVGADWIAYAPAGSADTVVTRWAYTDGGFDGSLVLEGPLSPGLYVARAYASDSYFKTGESSVFIVQ